MAEKSIYRKGTPVNRSRNDDNQQQISKFRTSESSDNVKLQGLFSKDLSLPAVTKFQSYASEWSIPEEAIENCLCDATGDGCIGFFRARRGPRSYAWYGLPLRNKEGAYNVLRVLHCVAAERELMVLFHVFEDLTVDSWDIYDATCREEGDGASRPLYVQVRLAEQVVKSYRRQLVGFDARVKAEMTKVEARKLDMIFSSELQNLHSLASDLKDRLYEIQTVHRVLTGLQSHIKVESLADSLKICLETATFLEGKLEKLLKTCKHMSRQVEASVHINNTNYIRTNVIALRRLGHSGVRENVHMRTLAEGSHADARMMKRFAVVTVLLLPISLASGIFSTPFFGMDDVGNFKYLQLHKTWVFFIVCGVIAILTLVFVYCDAIAWMVGFTRRSTSVVIDELLEKRIMEIPTPLSTPLPAYIEEDHRDPTLEPPCKPVSIDCDQKLDGARVTGFDRSAAASERATMMGYIDESFTLEYRSAASDASRSNGGTEVCKFFLEEKETVEIRVALDHRIAEPDGAAMG